MKKITIIISGIFIFLLILLVGCAREEKKVIFCDDSSDYQECVCPEGQKQIVTMGGISCVDNSFCSDFTLDDNKSACVKECPDGYIPLLVTGVGYSGTCLNIKTINQDNYEFYAGYLVLDNPKTDYLKRYNRDCWITKTSDMRNKFEISLSCDNYPNHCSFTIYPDGSFENNKCFDIQQDATLIKMKECKIDDDCITVFNHCCTNQGCIYDTINFKYDLLYREKNCDEIECPKQCFESFYVKCNNNQCQMIESK